MRITLNTDGTIAAIGYQAYDFPCPSFITFDNFQRYRCFNMSDIMNEESWEYTPIPIDPS